MLASLVPLVLALMHASDLAPLELIERLDNMLYDARLRATMPRTLDPRIVIIDIDEPSLETLGQWPWSRDKLSALTHELFERQQIALLGFDVIFGEPDRSSGLQTLAKLAEGPFKHTPGFTQTLTALAPSLDYDRQFSDALRERPVVLGYYFTSDRDGKPRGTLPAPVLRHEQLRGQPLRTTEWNGYGSNLDGLAQAAPHAGFFNTLPETERDGVVRTLPLLAQYQGHYYESLALAMYRTLLGHPTVKPGYTLPHATPSAAPAAEVLDHLQLDMDGRTQDIPVDALAAALIPYRGRGGPEGGSYTYIPAHTLLDGSLPPGTLDGKIALLGSTAPGLLDLRVTPVQREYPGVEAHANMLSALLDGRHVVRPDFSKGFDVGQLLLTGLVLACVLPHLSAAWAVGLTGAWLAGLALLNLQLYQSVGWAMPLANALLMVLTIFALNMVWGYFVETRAKRGITRRFATYVPPEVAEEIAQAPTKYTMEARSSELTVMFCDMRGFTAMSELMEPIALQALLNDVFTKLTQVIRRHHGTIDKYMGDCVMAFWGAPVPTAHHAQWAAEAAVEMTQTVQQINQWHAEQGLPAIGVGIGINTGMMCVGDMGSDIRLAYTVIGDAVNLASRLEGLSKVYGVQVVASEATQQATDGLLWQELDRVRVKGKEQAVTIYTCHAAHEHARTCSPLTLSQWNEALHAYRAQRWDDCRTLLLRLQAAGHNATLVQLYLDRVHHYEAHPPASDWDGSTTFETK